MIGTLGYMYIKPLHQTITLLPPHTKKYICKISILLIAVVAPFVAVVIALFRIRKLHGHAAHENGSNIGTVGRERGALARVGLLD